MEPLDGALRADTDEICPGCLQWFETGAYVRRNAYGLLQHEACPVRASRD
jgi:hypothetical protein